jgi:hypothetical protein
MDEMEEGSRMTDEEQAELDRMRTHCADHGLCCWYFSLEGEAPDEYTTEPIEQAG